MMMAIPTVRSIPAEAAMDAPVLHALAGLAGARTVALVDDRAIGVELLHLAAGRRLGTREVVHARRLRGCRDVRHRRWWCTTVHDEECTARGERARHRGEPPRRDRRGPEHRELHRAREPV